MNILNKISSIFLKFTANGGVVSLLGDTLDTTGLTSDTNTNSVFASIIGDIFFKLFYKIVSFLLGILDIIQLAIYRLLGIGENLDNYVVIDENNVLVKFLTNDVVTRVFRILFVVALVLIILYTVFAIVISEYKASTGLTDNKKGRIAARSLRSILMLTIFPMILLGGVFLTNALLVGFNNVFASNNGAYSSIGSNVFVMSSTTANKYRNYATSSVRVPILIDFDDPYKTGSAHGYTEEELLMIYDNFQYTGENLYRDFSYNNFYKFNKTLKYKNNTLYNTSKYEGFEKFIVTAEQYQVMADFIEYAMTYNINFYIKNIKDDDIEWKYVDKAIWNKDETKLTITYKDASDLNPTGDTYTVDYVPTSADINTPISDAFDTISNILAIGDYEDNLFNIMEREDDSINVVFWETDKVYLKLSNNYKVNPTYTDLLILYEYNRFSYNNTLNYTIKDLESGVMLPLYQIEKRVWRTDLLEYITTETKKVAYINGSYYRVYQPDENHAVKDSYGDFCFELVNPVSDIKDIYHADGTECYDNTCIATNSHFVYCPNHSDLTHLNNFVHYHLDGTVCYDTGCLENHVHKASMHLSALEKCEDVEHYTEICTDAGCREVHYAVNEVVCTDLSCNSAHYHKLASGEYESGKETPYEYCTNLSCGKTHYHVTFSEDSSGTLHHYYNNYPKCDGTNCETHNHYHFDGSRFTICHDSCYEDHYHSDGSLCNNVTCTEQHYHEGNTCESPYCADAKTSCVFKHYHSNGDECLNAKDCAETYHRHSAGVCGLVHLHSDNSICVDYKSCEENYHKHCNDWDCDDKNCFENHYHSDGSYCSSYETCTETTHLHTPCDGCREEHFYYVEPYYDECTNGISNCNKYHYHLSNDGNDYIDCTDTACTKTHYHYIYPTSDRCVYIDELEDPGHYNYIKNETFVDVLEYKLNGSFSNSVTLDGIDVTQTAYYDDIASKVLKKVNWPQKLATDMQTIYDEININLLISSGDWLTKLSEMVGSSMRNGFEGESIGENNTQTFDTSLIHPIGLMVSELFLNEIAEDRTSYFGDYEFKSSLSEDDIRSLLLSIGGEDNYRQLSLQVEYFVNMFNTYMEPVIEEVALKENFDLVEGTEVSEQLYTYKAYLCSILMSRTCMEYLFECTLSYIGASNFSYAVLNNDSLISSLEEYVKAYEEKNETLTNYQTGANGKLPEYTDVKGNVLSPSVELYLNVNIGYEDLKKVNEIEDDSILTSDVYVYEDYLTYLLIGSVKARYICTSDDGSTYQKQVYNSTIPGYENEGSEISAEELNDIIEDNIEDDIYYYSVSSFSEVSDYGELMDSDTFRGVADSKIYSYTEFEEAFINLQEFYSFSYAENWNENYYIENPAFGSDPAEPEYIKNSGYVEAASGNLVRDYLKSHLKFDTVYNNDHAEMILDIILANIKIIVTPTTDTKIAGVIDSTYKDFSELSRGGASGERDYQDYLTNGEGTGILDLLVAEMQSAGKTTESSDYEHIKALQVYVTDSANRKDYIDASDYSKGHNLVGSLNKLLQDVESYISNVESTGLGFFSSGVVGAINNAIILNRLDTMFIKLHMQNNEQDPDNRLELPMVTPGNLYRVLLDKIDSVIDKDGFDVDYEWTFNRMLARLMEQANSTSEDPNKGYKAATELLKEISLIISNYYTELTGMFELDKDYAEYITTFQSYAATIDKYLETLNKIDILYKYYITYAVTAYVSTHINTEFDVVVNSKHYTVGGNMSPGKLSEYLLGADFIKQMGYECSFVDDDYQGLINFTQNVTGGVVTYKLSNYLSYLNQFICDFGDAAMDIYNYTNFLELSSNAVDELVISDNPELMKYALYFLTQNDYLPADILCARFGLNIADYASYATEEDRYAAIQAAVKAKYDAATTDLQDLYVNAFEYLFISEDNENFSVKDLTLKELRLHTIKTIIDYQQNAGESDEINQKRYLALFYLSCASWNEDASWIETYVNSLTSYSDEQKQAVKTQLYEAVTGVDFRSGNIEYKDKDNNISSAGKTEISCINGLIADPASMGMVLRLAGIENRPVEELVGLEYSISFDWDAADEADGDLFVICTYDEENHYYVPFMMTNNYDVKTFYAGDIHDMQNRRYHGLALVEEGGSYSNWLTAYDYYDAVTEYYDVSNSSGNSTGATCFYPIIARGGFDVNNRPTAIRQNGKNIEFYRNDVIIRNASDIGLEMYYMSIEDAYSGGMISSIVNVVSKYITGKSLTERLVENIPRLNINFSLNVPYGVNDKVTENIENGETLLNYDFSGRSWTMESLYDDEKMNVVLLFIAVVVIFTFIFKALWGSIARIIDITALYILAPVVISTVALKSESKDKQGNMVESNDGYSGIYDRWKSQLVDKIFLALGYVVGLNIFYLLAPMVNETKLFTAETALAFADIPLIGKMPLGFFNAMGSLFMLIAVASAIIYAPTLISKITGFSDAMNYGGQAQNRVKQLIEESKDMISGQRLLDAAHSELQTMKSMIPGIELMQKGAQKIREVKHKVQVKALQAAASKAGIAGPALSKAVEAYEKSYQKQKERKKERSKQKDKERKEREQARQKWDGAD